METQFVNLTPHKINIYDEEKQFVVGVEPCGQIARLRVERRIERWIPFNQGMIPIYRTFYKEIEGLPAIVDGDTFYIVSALVKQHPMVASMINFVAPSELLRDEKGSPIGCVGLTL